MCREDHAVPSRRFREDDNFEEEDAPDEPVKPPVSLRKSLFVAGLFHIIHNAGNSMMDSCPVVDDSVDKMVPVCGLLRAASLANVSGSHVLIAKWAEGFIRTLNRSVGKCTGSVGAR